MSAPVSGQSGFAQAGLAQIGNIQDAGGGGGGITLVGSAGIPSAESFGCIGGTVNLSGDQSIYGTCGSGIPSAEAFGTGGALAIAPNLTGTVGIPTAEAFGTGGTLTINAAI